MFDYEYTVDRHEADGKRSSSSYQFQAIATNGQPADVQAPAEQELVRDLRILLATA